MSEDKTIAEYERLLVIDRSEIVRLNVRNMKLSDKLNELRRSKNIEHERIIGEFQKHILDMSNELLSYKLASSGLQANGSGKNEYRD